MFAPFCTTFWNSIGLEFVTNTNALRHQRSLYRFWWVNMFFCTVWWWIVDFIWFKLIYIIILKQFDTVDGKLLHVSMLFFPILFPWFNALFVHLNMGFVQVVYMLGISGYTGGSPDRPKGRSLPPLEGRGAYMYFYFQLHNDLYMPYAFFCVRERRDYIITRNISKWESLFLPIAQAEFCILNSDPRPSLKEKKGHQISRGSESSWEICFFEAWKSDQI